MERILTLPEAMFVAATRGMLGLGVGLLIAGRLSATQRRTAGGILAGIGVATTIPAAIAVIRRQRAVSREEIDEQESQAVEEPTPSRPGRRVVART